MHGCPMIPALCLPASCRLRDGCDRAFLRSGPRRGRCVGCVVATPPVGDDLGGGGDGDCGRLLRSASRERRPARRFTTHRLGAVTESGPGRADGYRIHVGDCRARCCCAARVLDEGYRAICGAWDATLTKLDSVPPSWGPRPRPNATGDCYTTRPQC